MTKGYTPSTLWAYLAGLVDADGCLSLCKVDKGRHQPALSFVNTSIELVTLFSQEFGGRVYAKTPGVYEVIVRKSEDVTEACERLIPFLIFKKDKAMLVKAFAESVMSNKNCKLTPDVIKHREGILSEWETLK